MINQIITNSFASLATRLPLASGPFDWLFSEWWFRESASEVTSSKVDWIYEAILWICVFFFILIVGVMVAFVARYYARPGHVAEHTAHHSNSLEAFWSIIPSFIVLWIFAVGFINYIDLRTPPEGAYEIQVVAKKWNWSFIYPNGFVDSNLHVPEDQAVRLVMSSDDVLHSLYIPAFRVKMDCVPGRYSTLWFQADTANDEDYDPTIDANLTGSDENGYDLFCTEYCGQGHSAMIAKVIVHKSGTFDTWLSKAIVWDESESPVERGASLYKRRGCAQCHSLDGSKGTGPTYKGTYGTKQMTSAGEVTVDENYIRESILNPMAKIRDGYKGVMPSYQGQLNEQELAALIWFHKSLSPDSGVAIPATWAEVGGVPGQEATEEPEEDSAEDSEEDSAAEESTEEPATTEEPVTTEEPATDEPAAEKAA